MTTSKYTLLFSFVLLLAASEFARAQNGVCRVTVFSVDHSIPHSARFSDPVLIGEFELNIKGSMLVHRLPHKETGVSVIVGIMRLKSEQFNKKRTALRISLQLQKDGADSYSFYGGATETIYDKNWKGSSVSSHLRVGDYKGYTYTVACEKRKE